MKIAIIGSGYVGLTTGVIFSDVGHNVICVDNDLEKIERLKKGDPPIFEPKLSELIKKNLENHSLYFSNDTKKAIEESEIIFICVNTPPKNDGRADLKYVEKVAKEIAQSINDYKVIVDKSTVPLKTAEKVKETILKYCPSHIKFDVVSNPEFLREGSAVYDSFYPDRIIIGAESDRARKKMLDIYKPIIKDNPSTIIFVSIRSAEIIKHGANTFLAAKISFANLMAELCENANTDVLEVLEAIGKDKRIGNKFLNPGIGFGGSCFPKDIAAFKKTLEILGVDSSFVTAIETINTNALNRFIKKIEKELWVLDGKQIGILGLSFKPNTDDIRNAPALKIIQLLLEEGSTIRVYDPKAMDNTKKVFPQIHYCQDPYHAAEGSEALILCTEWDEFENLDFLKIKKIMNTPIIFDGRNLYHNKKLNEMGIKYYGIGR